MSASSALLGALFHSLWQVGLLAMLFAVFRFLSPQPRHRYLAAIATLALQVAWPSLTLAQRLALRLQLATPATFETSGRWQWVAVVWSLGAALMLIRTVGGLWVVRGWVRSSASPAPEVIAKLEALRTRLEVRAVRWAMTARVAVPLTVGFLRPAVLLPVSLLTAVPSGDLELLAAHELMHVRRWDYLVNLGQTLVEAALFFHPAMWWVSRCARAEREYCCDDAVVDRLGAARPYARALLSLEESLTPVVVAVPSTGGQFMHRIQRILGTRNTVSFPSLGALVGIVALVVLMGCAAQNLRAEPAAVAAPPELVPSLRTLCSDIRADAMRPELKEVDPLDLMTVVLADLGEANPALEHFMSEVAKAPVPQRREVLKRSVSQAIGKDWACPEFDALWDGKPLAAN